MDAKRWFYSQSFNGGTRDAVQPKSSFHTKDEDCMVGPNGCCTVCGVDHTGECPQCGGRGFHRANCPELSGGAA